MDNKFHDISNSNQISSINANVAITSKYKHFKCIPITEQLFHYYQMMKSKDRNYKSMPIKLCVFVFQLKRHTNIYTHIQN